MTSLQKTAEVYFVLTQLKKVTSGNVERAKKLFHAPLGPASDRYGDESLYSLLEAGRYDAAQQALDKLLTKRALGST